MFVGNIFQEIKDRSDIVEVVEHFGVHLDRKNMAKCPFHKEKTASFSINSNKQIWKCFGCQRGGDSISFVQELLNCSAYEAAKQINIICNCGIDFKIDKTRPKFEYNKDYAKYKADKQKEEREEKEKNDCYNQLFEASCIVNRYWNNLYIDSKLLDIELFKDELNIIYKNRIFFNYITELFDNDIDYILNIKDYLIKILERGIIYMDFDKIAVIAFKEEEMPKSSTNIELLTYYMLKELYIKHYKKQISDVDAKKEKQKIKGFFDKQNSIEEFNNKLQKKICDNINKSQDEIIKINKMINNNADIKDLLDISIDCISNLTDNTVLIKMYKEKYKSQH